MWRWWRRRRWNVSVWWWWWWWWWRWRRWRWSRTLVVVTVEPDGHAARLVGNGHGVDVVPAVVTRGARPESGVAIVLESAVAGQAETAGWRGTFITLPLRRRRREDAATTVRIRQAAGVDAVLTLRHRQVSLAYAVLSVRKLADAAARTPIGGEMEAAGIAAGVHGQGTGRQGQGLDKFHIVHSGSGSDVNDRRSAWAVARIWMFQPMIECWDSAIERSNACEEKKKKTSLSRGSKVLKYLWPWTVLREAMPHSCLSEETSRASSRWRLRLLA